MKDVNTRNQKSDGTEELQLVSFHIETEEFAVNILKIQSIIRLMEITSVPNSPDFVNGVINLRGVIIPIISLRKRLGIVEKEYNNQTRIIVVDFDNQVVGFVVDSVNEVIRINSNITEPPPTMVGSIDSEYITAVGKLDDRLLILLDLEKTLGMTEKNELQDIAEAA